MKTANHGGDGHVGIAEGSGSNPGINELAAKRIARSGTEVDQRRLDGEALPFDDGTFDGVVSTWTMYRGSAIKRGGLMGR